MFYQIEKNNSVSSTMFLKLTIKVVAFFLGHPVYFTRQKRYIVNLRCAHFPTPFNQSFTTTHLQIVRHIFQMSTMFKNCVHIWTFRRMMLSNIHIQLYPNKLQNSWLSEVISFHCSIFNQIAPSFFFCLSHLENFLRITHNSIEY